MVLNLNKMNDFEALTAWIQPRHLSASGIDARRAAFENHRLRLVHMTDFLKPDRAANLGRFLGREASYRQVYSLYSTHRETYGDWVSVDRWQATDEAERCHTYGMLTGPDPRFRLSPNLFTFLEFRKVLVTSAFGAYLSAVTGLPLGEIVNPTVHRMRPGDFLKPHDDRIEGRRVAFVLYLSPGWKADYGGTLHISGKDDECSRIEAAFNSLVVFDLTAHKSHHVTDIRDTAGDRTRLTMGGWFHGPEHR